MVKGFDGGDQLIKNWLQNKNTIEFLSVWEELNNPDFNLVELHQIKNSRNPPPLGGGGCQERANLASYS